MYHSFEEYPLRYAGIIGDLTRAAVLQPLKLGVVPESGWKQRTESMNLFLARRGRPRYQPLFLSNFPRPLFQQVPLLIKEFLHRVRNSSTLYTFSFLSAIYCG
jgi:hypothetical protein